ncbi:MAG TPA: glyoxalase superfamily protein [Caulobacteraceae bacterium]|jgi:catechol 2,3-dioxygenase-like lactoylglutathione lyase family enzyme
MTDIQQAKQMARALRQALAAKSIDVTHSQSLELVAQSLGHADWNTLCGAAPTAIADDGVSFDPPIPILRMFDVAKAKAFYVDLLGFRVDWEHRFEPGFPLYMQVSRGGMRLHLSEHHGDGTPGTVVWINVTGLDALHAELHARGSRAGIEPGPAADMRVLHVWDPFGSVIRFAETQARAPGEMPEGYSVAAR